MQEITVATFPNEIAAQLAAQQLAAVDIRSVLVPLGGGAGIWGTATMLPHALRVLEGDAERARRVLADDADERARPRPRYRRHGAPPTPGRDDPTGHAGGASMTAGRDLHGLISGAPVLTPDGATLGTVSAIRGRAFKVDVSLRPDYWLRADAIRSVAGGQVILGVDKERLDDYKVDPPSTA